MSLSLNQAHGSPGDARFPAQPAHAPTPRWLILLYTSVVVLVLVAVVIMRLYHLGLPFDRDGYDEGVYWQSLRAMLAGQHLYGSVFYSQPPFFLLSTYPGFALFGGSLWSARLGIALVSLPGFLGAYLLGHTLAGRRGTLAGLLLLLTNSLYLAQSQTIQAEAASVSFTLLAMAFALLWWQQPSGWRGLSWAILCGVTFALSVLAKLLCVSTIVPIGLLMLARAWQIARGQAGADRYDWLPILAGIGATLLTTLLVLAPFSGSWQNFWAGVVSFHEVAAQAAAQPAGANVQKILTALFSLTTLAAAYGSLAALPRRDWRVLPLLAWLLVTLVLLYKQQPLFVHHLIALEPPLITLALLGMAGPASYRTDLAWLQSRTRLHTGKLAALLSGTALLLLLATVVVNCWQDLGYYRAADAYSTSSLAQQDLRVARDLQQAISPDQWVITDGQFVAALAGRSTPPALVDTSTVRLVTGYLTLAQLEQATLDSRVHAVLFYTNRFSTMQQGKTFRAWVAARFHLFQKYSQTQELWVR